MATVINDSDTNIITDANAGAILGTLIVVVLVGLFAIVFLPMLWSGTSAEHEGGAAISESIYLVPDDQSGL